MGKNHSHGLRKKVRPEQGIPAVLRYETKPGVQAQVDWGELGTVEVDGKVKKLFCFNMIFGYSRMRFGIEAVKQGFRFTLPIQETLLKD